MATKQQSPTAGRPKRATLGDRYWSPGLDAVQYGISLHDRHHTTVRANQALSALVDKSLDDILGEKCGTLLYGRATLPKDSPLSHLGRVQEHREVQVSLPGRDRVVRVHFDPLLDGRGRFEGYICAWFDVTDSVCIGERCSDMIENVPAMIHCIDMDGNIIFVNQTEADALGYTKDELLTMHWRDIFPSVTNDEVREDKRRLLEEGKMAAEDFAVTKDGRRIPMRGAGTLRYRNGEPLYIMFVWHDISAIKQAEEALRESERELAIRNKIAHVFLTIPDEEMYGEALRVILEAMESKHGVFGYIDEDGAMVFPSMTRDVWEQCQVPEKDIVFPREAWGGIWGRVLREKKALYSNEPGRVPEGHILIERSLGVPIIHRRKVIGLLLVANKATDYDERDRQLLETITQAIAPILHARLQRDREERERKRAEEELRKHRDRLDELVEERTLELTRANEELLQEIEERKRVEEALRRSEERFSIAFQASPLGIAISRIDDGRFIDVNDSYLQLVGYSREEVIGRTAPELGIWLDPKDRERAVRAVRQEGTIRNFEVQVRRKSGEIRDVVSSFTMVDLRGEPCWLVMAEDISERKRAEELVQRERDRAKRYLDVAGVMFVVIEADQRVSLANKRACEVLECEEEEIIGKNWFDSFVPRRLRENVRAVFATLMAGDVEPVEYYENPVLTKGGKERIIAWRNTILRDDEGEAYAVLSSGEDITERKRAEEELRESEQRFRNVLDVSRDLIYKLNLQTKSYDYVSPSALQLSGFTPEEVLAMGPGGVNERFHPEERQRLRVPVDRLFDRVADDGMAARIEYRWKRKDGEYRWFSDNRVLVRDEDGRPIAVVGTVRDITEQKLAEQALRESEERFRNIFESVSECMICLDTSGRIVEVNEKAVQVFGGSKEELLGGLFEATGVFDHKDMPRIVAAFSSVLAGEEATLDLYITNRKGNRIPLECSASLMRRDGQPAGVMVIARDVSERKRAEEEHHQLREHRKMVRALEQMAATLGHELRNPLGVISNSVYFLANQAGIDDPNVEKHVGIIDREVASAKRTVNDILEFAHVPELVSAEVSLNSVIERAVARSQIPANIRVTCRWGVAPLPIVCDEERLERAFVDIITNAVQAMPHGGRLGVRSRVSDDGVAVSFSDSGEGIARENLPRIFDPMFTTKLRGVGLGLTVVRRTVEQHGGRVDVRSRPGRGTTLTVTLPRQQRPPEPGDERVAEPARQA